MVHMEQTEVQGQLDNLQKSDASGYKQAIIEINGFLNASGIEGAAARAFPTDRAYGQVWTGRAGWITWGQILLRRAGEVHKSRLVLHS